MTVWCVPWVKLGCVARGWGLGLRGMLVASTMWPSYRGGSGHWAVSARAWGNLGAWRVVFACGLAVYVGCTEGVNCSVALRAILETGELCEHT